MDGGCVRVTVEDDLRPPSEVALPATPTAAGEGASLHGFVLIACDCPTGSLGRDSPSFPSNISNTPDSQLEYPLWWMPFERQLSHMPHPFLANDDSINKQA